MCGLIYIYLYCLMYTTNRLYFQFFLFVKNTNKSAIPYKDFHVGCMECFVCKLKCTMFLFVMSFSCVVFFSSKIQKISTFFFASKVVGTSVCLFMCVQVLCWEILVKELGIYLRVAYLCERSVLVNSIKKV